MGWSKVTSKLVSAGMGILAGAAAVLTIGAGSAAADTLKPQPSQPGAGPAVEGGVRAPGIQGELRGAGMGEAMANGGLNGEVRGSNMARPPFDAWSFSGAGGDLSACVIDGPYCQWWMSIPFDANNP